MRFWILVAALLILLIAASAANSGSARAAGSPITFSGETPAPGGVTGSTTPTISVSYHDNVSTIPVTGVFLFVNGINVTSFGETTITPTKVTYDTPSILALKNGVHNVSVQVIDLAGNTARAHWNFTVNTNITTGPANPLAGLKPLTLLFYTAIVAAIAGAVVGGYILFLKQTTRFTFRRYFATHQVETKYYTIYIPMGVAFLFILFGLSLVYSNPSWPANSVDYVFIIALFIALTAWGIDARREMMRIRAYERAFAQFLFELADAMRGGLDPAKSIVELAKTYTNILAKHLRIASDGIRLGRPLDLVLTDMVSRCTARSSSGTPA